ncbi:MAG: CBS domain-containing protein [Rhodospirillales bacterium]|nr:CBS domain-containing protein [Alphaproteobacteria bacterium]MBL6947345.1 CBS domain-containing protein [Rhodospirillales bacterium]
MTEKKITRVMDVMTKGVITVEPTAKVSEAIKLMREKRTSSVVVERRNNDDEFGLVVVTDIAKQVLGKDLSPQRVNVYEIMSKPILTLAAEMNVVYAVRMLVRFELTRAMVVDHGRNPLGIVTLRDMVLRLEDEKTS